MLVERAMPLLSRLGRRVPMCVLHLLVGVALLAVIIIQQTAPANQRLVPLTITLSLIGKMAISASFAITVFFTKELVPTNIRLTYAYLYSSCLVLFLECWDNNCSKADHREVGKPVPRS